MAKLPDGMTISPEPGAVDPGQESATYALTVDLDPRGPVVTMSVSLLIAMVNLQAAALAFTDWADTEPGKANPLRFSDPDGNRTLDALRATARKLPRELAAIAAGSTTVRIEPS